VTAADERTDPALREDEGFRASRAPERDLVYQSPGVAFEGSGPKMPMSTAAPPALTV